jgi:2,3-bisphosphoglycerate-independent phosphoglycerate mutase
MKIIFIVLDGLADAVWPSPLFLAEKPNISNILSKAFVGKIYPLAKNYWPKSGSASVSGLANLGLLGYKVRPEKIKRGVLEAIGSDVPFKNGWLAIRFDFGTVDENLKVIDRRAGRETFGLDNLISSIRKIKFEIPFFIKRTYGHRGVILFKKKLSPYISDSDPFSAGKKVKKIRNLKNDPLSKKTSEIVQKFLNLAYEILKNHPVNELRKQKGFLPANYLLTREAGNKILKLKPFSQKYGFKKCMAIAENGVMSGTCKLAGFELLKLPEIHELEKRWQKISLLLKRAYSLSDFIYIHFKELDEASHDKNPEKKKIIFEKFDDWFGREIKKYKEAKWIITGDHITDSRKGKHKFGPVPLLIYPSQRPNNVKSFDEKIVKKLDTIDPHKLWFSIKVY